VNNNKKYEGQLVFLERQNSGKDSTYYNGEYACIRATPTTLYCVKPVVGYDFHSVRQFSLVGSEKYEVVEAHDDIETIRGLVNANKKWASDGLNGVGKRQWCESVYSGAANSADQLERAITGKHPVASDSPVTVVESGGGFSITIPTGKPVTIQFA
jgi:hypothetical protein